MDAHDRPGSEDPQCQVLGHYDYARWCRKCHSTDPIGAPLIDAARELLGVPFHHLGRTAAGVDCVGLLYHVAKRMGWDYPVIRYEERGSPILAQWLDTLLVRVDDDQPLRTGMVLLIAPRGAPAHVMMATVPGYVIHARWRQHVQEHTFDRRWWRRLVAVYDWPELGRDRSAG